jgi:hypothetical protein
MDMFTFCHTIHSLLILSETSNPIVLYTPYFKESDMTQYGTKHAKFSDGNTRGDNFRQGMTTFF